MAIINSVVMGKARNKIGNLILYFTKGNTIARSYNAAPINPDTSSQQDKRHMYYSAQRVSNELFPFYSGYFWPKRKYKVLRNWFFVQVYPFMPLRRLVNLGFTLVRLNGKSFGYDNRLSINALDLVGNHIIVRFACSVDVQLHPLYLSAFYWDSINLELVFFTTQITTNQVLAGSCDIGVYQGGGDVRGALLNCPSLKRSSNILFAPIV